MAQWLRILSDYALTSRSPLTVAGTAADLSISRSHCVPDTGANIDIPKSVDAAASKTAAGAIQV